MRSACRALASGLGQRLGAPAVRTGDHESHRVVGIRGHDVVERAHQSREVLAGLDRAERDDVPGGTGQRPTAGGAGRRAVGRERRDPVRHGDDAGRGIGVLGPDLVRHPLAHRVDPGAAPHRPGDQTGVGARVAVGQLGEAPRGEVVDGDDPRRPPARRDDEVRSVDHVQGADEPLDRWEVGPDPAGPEGTGRHRAPGGPHTRRQELGQPAPSPPGDRERGHLETGLPAEGFQDLLGDHTDAGPRAVQGRGVDTDPHHRRI